MYAALLQPLTLSYLTLLLKEFLDNELRSDEESSHNPVFVVLFLLYCIVVVLFPKRSFYSSECLAICVRVMSESCQGHVGHVRAY